MLKLHSVGFQILIVLGLTMSIVSALGAQTEEDLLKGEALERSLDNLQGAARFEVLYRWMELFAGELPEKSLAYGLESIDLLSPEIEPDRAYFVYLWTARAAWLLGRMELASELTGQAISAIRKTGDRALEFEALLLQASADRRLGRFLAAAEHGQRLVKIAPTRYDRVMGLNSLAMSYKFLEDLPMALDTYLEALEICVDTEGCEEFLGTLYANFGRIHALLGHFDEAIEATQKALEILNRFESLERAIAFTLYNLGSFQKEAGHFEEAQAPLEEALAILESLGDEGQVNIFVMSELAIVRASLNRSPRASNLAREALRLARAKENDAWILKAQVAVARVERRLGNLRVAKEQMELAVELAESIGDRILHVEALRELAEIHQNLDNPQSALKSFQQAAELHERMVNEKNQARKAEWQARLDITKTEADLVRAENIKVVQAAEIKQQETVGRALVIVIALLSLSGLGVAGSYRRQQRTLGELEVAHGRLRLKKRKLEDALSQVNLLSGMLPICASCKSIRDDQGYWQMVEEYITNHSEAQFSHGLCPKCAEELFPELSSYQK